MLSTLKSISNLMDRTLALELCHEHRRRAHWFGAEAVILEKEASKLLEQAKIAKRRYFSELAKADQAIGRNGSFADFT